MTWDIFFKKLVEMLSTPQLFFEARSCIIFFTAETEIQSKLKEHAILCVRYLDIFSPSGCVIFLDKFVPTDAKKMLKWSAICLASLIFWLLTSAEPMSINHQRGSVAFT